MVQLLWKTVCHLQLNIYLRYNPAILLRGIYQRERKAYVHTKTHTQMSAGRRELSKRGFGGVGYVLFFDLGGGYMGVFIL